jgi:hypothetical protein
MNKRVIVYISLLSVTLFLVWKAPTDEGREYTIVQPSSSHNRDIKSQSVSKDKVISTSTYTELRKPQSGDMSVDLFELYRPQTLPKANIILNQPKKNLPPRLPLKYLGKMVDNNGISIFILHGDALHIVQQGGSIDNMYRLDSITDQLLIWTYLPLNLSQEMKIGTI